MDYNTVEPQPSNEQFLKEVRKSDLNNPEILGLHKNIESNEWLTDIFK